VVCAWKVDAHDQIRLKSAEKSNKATQTLFLPRYPRFRSGPNRHSLSFTNLRPRLRREAMLSIMLHDSSHCMCIPKWYSSSLVHYILRNLLTLNSRNQDRGGICIRRSQPRPTPRTYPQSTSPIRPLQAKKIVRLHRPPQTRPKMMYCWLNTWA
jgi:hypothetical protein